MGWVPRAVSLPDRLLGVWVEEVEAVDGDGELDAVAGAYRESGVDACDTVGRGSGAVEIEGFGVACAGGFRGRGWRWRPCGNG